MSFDDLISDVNDICVDVLGDAGVSITDGTASKDPLPGFFRHSWDESTSNRFGFMADMPSYESKTADLVGLDLSKIGSTLKLTHAGRVYVVMDQRVDKGMALLVLQR